MKYNFIKTEVNEYIFTLILARPEKRNAFTPTMINEIEHAIESANLNNEVKVVVIKAEGPVFCAGMDLKTFQDPSKDIKNPAIENKTLSMGKVMEGLYKPSVAIVQGDVIAGGVMIIANCTYVFAEKLVRFRLPELNLGIFPFQVMASLMKVMPEKQMLQMCLQTEYFPIEKAMEYGLVDGVLEEINVEDLLLRFSDMSTSGMVAGMKAAKKLASIDAEARYDYLLERLEELKSSEDVKNEIFKKQN